MRIPTWMNLWGLQQFLEQLTLNLKVALCCMIKKHLGKEIELRKEPRRSDRCQPAISRCGSSSRSSQEECREQGRKGLTRQKGTIALKWPDCYQNTLGLGEAEASFSISSAQNDNELVGPPGSRFKEVSCPGDQHR